MDWLQALWLGLVQGLTEFLPISSSGHFMLLSKVFDMHVSNAFNVLLHAGTLLAVVVVYWKRLLNMLLHPIKSDLWKLVVATLPLVASALLLDEYFPDDFQMEFLGYAFLITTLILWLSDLVAGVSFETKQVRWYNVLAMGFMQALSVPAGISRSGSTIAGGIATGLSRKRAADFAFMMSVPAILGAIAKGWEGILELPTLVAGGSILPLVVGFVVAAISGFLAIRFMLTIVRRVRLPWFGLYTGILGVLILLDQYVFHRFF